MIGAAAATGLASPYRNIPRSPTPEWPPAPPLALMERLNELRHS